MSRNSDTVFICAGINPWYCTGAERFKGSLIANGFDGDMQVWVNEWPPGHFPRGPVYNVKAAAFEYAIKCGYKTIAWADASVTALCNVRPFFDAINANGYWIGQSGYNCAQVCGDAMLRYFGVDRDWAETIPDCATGLFGVDMTNPRAAEFIKTWIAGAREGAFSGSRHHDKQSKDRRFLFGRQDQAAASLILGKMGMPLFRFLDFAGFKWDMGKHTLMFKVEGM